MDRLTAMARLPPLPLRPQPLPRAGACVRDEPIALAPAPSRRLREYAERLRAWQPNVTCCHAGIRGRKGEAVNRLFFRYQSV